MTTAINYHNRHFRSISNTDNGEVDADTIFHYRQADSGLWGTYQGGKIRFGSLVGTVHASGALDFRYQHINHDGTSMFGVCHSEPELLPDGRIRLHERWQWLSGDQSRGESIVEEILLPVATAQSLPPHLPVVYDDDHPPFHSFTKGNYTIITDPAALDSEAIHAFLSRSYWASGCPFHIVARALEHSLCFGLYHDKAQVGLVRVITDYTIFAYLCDVYVLEEHRGQGLGKWLIKAVLDYPPLGRVRRWTLATRDAHDFYRLHGFGPLAYPASQMEFRRTISWD